MGYSHTFFLSSLFRRLVEVRANCCNSWTLDYGIDITLYRQFMLPQSSELTSGKKPIKWYL